MPRISYCIEPTGEQARISQPTLASVKTQLCQRLGKRPHELSFEARELLDIYVRAKSKVIAIDNFLAQTAVVVDDGRVTPALRAYVNFLKASVSCLTALTQAIKEMPRDENGRIDHALEGFEPVPPP
jgi:hypothetical protein